MFEEGFAVVRSDDEPHVVELPTALECVEEQPEVRVEISNRFIVNVREEGDALFARRVVENALSRVIRHVAKAARVVWPGLDRARALPCSLQTQNSHRPRNY